ncbi:MAG: septal ring lytic transglycosylase RlpA family protein [Candidatus Kapabacteria bacterium]|nr:septal ring lytic transglycosylase RlpA family protein [Candidatus Kapabacteria bacterium]
MADSAVAIDSLILRRVRQGKTPRGTTLSDTLTARRLAEQPEEGTASYYAEKFHGRLTSSGERFNMHDSTCAHRWLPFGTKLRVTNIANDRSVIVRVNDRGPWKHGRILDVSKAAAVALDMVRMGTARVRIEVVSDSTDTRTD